MLVHSFVEAVRRAGVVDPDRLDGFAARCPPDEPAGAVAARMVADGLLTAFQAEQLAAGGGVPLLIKGKYRVLREIGAGGVGRVYLAEHVKMRRKVAVKLLPPRFAENPAAVARFRREAAALAALDHPNVVRAFDADDHDGVPYLAMEYADGTDLHRLVAARGPLPPAEAANLSAQAAAGLGHAHAAGWVHRDVKPANLLVEPGGRVRVLDLGLARLFDGDGDHLTTQTEGAAVMGTADYMAPEQSIDSTAVDHRADVYSLGATLYFLLAGRPPFADQRTLALKLFAHQAKDPPPLRTLRPDVPDELADLAHRMMAKRPDDRPQSLGEVAAALATIAGGSGVAVAGAAFATPSDLSPPPTTTPIDVAPESSPPSAKEPPATTSSFHPDELAEPPDRPRGAGLWAVTAGVVIAAVLAAVGAVASLPSARRPPADADPTPVDPPQTPRPQPPPEAGAVRIAPREAEFLLDGKPVVTYHYDASRVHPSFGRIATPSGVAAVSGLHFAFIGLTEDGKLRYDIRSERGTPERLAWKPGAAATHTLDYVRKFRNRPLDVRQAVTLRVARVGPGFLVLASSRTTGPANLGVDGAAWGVSASLAADLGPWTFKVWPDGKGEHKELTWTELNRSVVAWAGGPSGPVGVAVFIAPNNSAPTRLSTARTDTGSLATRGSLSRTEFDPIKPLDLAYGVYVFDAPPADAPTGLAVKEAHAAFLKYAAE